MGRLQNQRQKKEHVFAECKSKRLSSPISINLFGYSIIPTLNSKESYGSPLTHPTQIPSKLSIQAFFLLFKKFHKSKSSSDF